MRWLLLVAFGLMACNSTPPPKPCELPPQAVVEYVPGYEPHDAAVPTCQASKHQ